MIRLKDATTLAFTKLRTRKVRLIVTVVISGLLFSILAGASIVSRGAFSSISDFGSEGLASRFIVQAYPANTKTDYFNNQEILDRADALQKDLIARKKAEAKRLGIDYSADNEQSPVQEYDTPNGKQKTIDLTSPLALQAVEEYAEAHPFDDQQQLKAASKRYNPKAYYRTRAIPYTLNGARLKVLAGGKETYEEQKNGGYSYGPPRGLDSFVTSWNVMSKGLLEPFVLPGQNLKRGSDGSLPVIVPISAAEELLQLKSLPSTASDQQKLERTRIVRDQAAQTTFSVCYRNAASESLVQDALNTQKQIDANKGKKDYKQPDYIVSLPTEACGTSGVSRDVRTKEEKALAAKQLQFDQTFGEQAPAQETIKFRIVGVVPDMSMGGGATNVTEIIKSMVQSSLGSGWYTPLEEASQNARVAQIFNLDKKTNPMGSDGYSVEFSSADSAKQFIKDQNCSPDWSQAQPGAAGNPFEACEKKGTQFSLNAYGSNSLGLDSAKQTFGKVFTLAALGVAVVASIIMMGTVGKMIADSRRETAVFRAIGAKKLDIAQIYMLYTIFLSTLITLFAVALGTVAAFIVQYNWGDIATVQAILAYNTQDLDKVFRLYHFHLPDMLYLLAVAVVAGGVSAAFPLVRNLRRNPMRDMRDDT